MAVTIRDIAKHAKVSVSTVSRVLNEKPDVNEETKKRVTEAIEELGYSPNIVARGLVLQKSNVIGFIVPDIMNPSFPELARGVVARAKSHGYSVMFFDTNHDKRVEKEAIRLLQSKQVDGIILSFNQANKEELEKLKLEKFPVVQIYRKSDESAISTIALDNFGSGYKAVKYLLDMGHRRIGHITTGNHSQSGYERLKGYRKGLDEADISYNEELIVEGENSVEAGTECMRMLLNLSERPTAVFASHDVMAIGAYEAVYNAGLSIPEDISIVGHDNLPLSVLVRPKLTTIDTHKRRLGEAGVDLLIEEMAAGQPLNKEEVFDTELIIRESVKALR
ncbi:MAG: LacI family DNA-binding transcriptional regulator [Spirochaetales bacterium]|nr:LacI family DNA-binding transcriptional regulator [Spirochaetales bacterium]